MAKEIIGPASPYQVNFLNASADIIIAGGAVGSSKSYIGLMRHLRWKDDKFYRGFCFRKNSVTLMASGGLFEAAAQMYRQVDPGLKIKEKKQQLVFSSGATISFKHYEKDSDGEKIRGLEISNGFYDEGTDASEEHIWMIISRLRATRAKVNPSLWITCNPNPDVWLREWVDHWLYPEGHEKAGFPDPDKNGKIRWMLRVDGVKFWGDSKEELIERYGKPDLAHDHPQQVKPLSVQVLLGTIYDNPILIERNPEYLARLEGLPKVKRDRDLHGNWNAREKGSTYFDRTWCEEIVGYEPSQIDKIVRAYDFAGSLKTDANPSPDYTVGALMAKMKNGDYVVLDVKRTRIQFGAWEKFIVENALEDREKFREVTILVPEDPNPAAKAACSLLIRSLAESGLYAQRMRASTSKLDRFRPFSAMAEQGGVKFLKGCGTDLENKVFNSNEFVYRELEAFDGTRRRGELGHDRFVVVYKPT